MSGPSKELLAAPHVGFLLNEAALKQHGTMFGRIAVQELKIVLRNAHFVTPEFARNRARLAEMGILFEPDMQKLTSPVDDAYRNSFSFLMNDVNEILKPFGTSVEEMIAARNDEAKAARIKQKTAQSRSTYESNMGDPQKLIETEQRLSVNLTRLFALQVRKIEGRDACATIPSGDNTLDHDDQRPEQHDIMKISVVVPVPDETVSWDDILQYREDPDSQNRFIALKEWMSDVACGSLTGAEVGEKLEVLLDRYRKLLETHQVQINWTRLEAYVVTRADVLRELDAFRQTQRSGALFSVEGRNLTLLEGESTSAGSEVAFVIQAKSMLAS
jgi:hypothetical protein